MSLSPTFYGHDREEVTRILIQGLNDMGYQSAATALSSESGYSLETPHAAAFRTAILHGDWDTAQTLMSGNLPDEEGGLRRTPNSQHARTQDRQSPENGSTPRRRTRGLSLSPEADRSEMLFLIRQQKYLELLELRDLGSALMVLRQELQPLHQEESRLHALSTLMMCKTSDDLKLKSSWDGTLGDSRKELLSQLSHSISPSAMIPEHRLADLMTQVKDSQMMNCQYHNSSTWPSLYQDHICERSELPIDILNVLDGHQNEVWYLQFSNDGTRLATAGKDKTVVIYETTYFRQLHVLDQHRDSVVYVAWSPDDKKLISCARDKVARLWDTDSGRCIRTITYHEEPVTTAAWAPDGLTFVTGSLDINTPLAVWNTDPLPPEDGFPVHNFKNQCARVQDCAISAPASAANTAIPVRLAAMCCTDNTIYLFDYLRSEEFGRISLEHPITCLNFSSDGNDMLINLSCDEIWAIDVETGDTRHKFQGHKQSHFVIKSCFGGASEGFVVCGGEDGTLTIWHRHTARILEQLPAHASKCVNAVAWNPANRLMFASAGDDNKVRIWGRASVAPPRLPPQLLYADGQIQTQQPGGQTPFSASVAAAGDAAARATLPRWGSSGVPTGAGMGGGLSWETQRDSPDRGLGSSAARSAR
ncbi:MAG: hypothetical protein M1828_002096 [Chrysothrix sp. TS-e1954]|nr:MAG: hypothetical protein M1828_002096 [Chrysothrix sp. TS-e1954]